MAREKIGTCEVCSKPIYEGDKYHGGNDVDLCHEHAPTFADMIEHPEQFLDENEMPLTAEVVRDRYNAHIAGGGLPSDKIVWAA